MPTTYYHTVNNRVVGETTSGVRTDYMRDALGSVTGTTIAGVAQNTYRWKPYGGLLAKTGTAADPKFQWNGGSGYRATQRAHSDYYVRARHFAATEGMWTGLDAFWPQQLAFVYVLGRAPQLSDPTGLAIWPMHCCCNAYTIEMLPKDETSGNVGRTEFLTTVSWPVKAQGGFSCGYRVMEKANTWDPDGSYQGMPVDQWIDVSHVIGVKQPFPGCVQRQAAQCPSQGGGQCTDSDTASYNCKKAKYYGLPSTRCLCIRVDWYSGCDTTSSFKIFSQTVRCTTLGSLIDSNPPHNEPITTKNYCLDQGDCT